MQEKNEGNEYEGNEEIARKTTHTSSKESISQQKEHDALQTSKTPDGERASTSSLVLALHHIVLK